MPPRDRVNPVKWERPSEGGTEDDDTPAELDHHEDYINARGMAFQNATSNDEAVVSERDSDNNMVFTDAFVSGVKLKDLSSGGIYSEAYYAESNGESQTSSTSYQQKLRLTFTPKSAGNFEIRFSCLVVGSTANKYLRTRVQVDDTTTYKENAEYPGFAYANGYWGVNCGSFVVNLTAVSHNIDLDFCVAGTQTPTMYIKEAVMTARRL